MKLTISTGLSFGTKNMLYNVEYALTHKLCFLEVWS